MDTVYNFEGFNIYDTLVTPGTSDAGITDTKLGGLLTAMQFARAQNSIIRMKTLMG